MSVLGGFRFCPLRDLPGRLANRPSRVDRWPFNWSRSSGHPTSRSCDNLDQRPQPG